MVFNGRETWWDVVVVEDARGDQNVGGVEDGVVDHARNRGKLLCLEEDPSQCLHDVARPLWTDAALDLEDVAGRVEEEVEVVEVGGCCVVLDVERAVERLVEGVEGVQEPRAGFESRVVAELGGVGLEDPLDEGLTSRADFDVVPPLRGVVEAVVGGDAEEGVFVGAPMAAGGVHLVEDVSDDCRPGEVGHVVEVRCVVE